MLKRDVGSKESVRRKGAEIAIGNLLIYTNTCARAHTCIHTQRSRKNMKKRSRKQFSDYFYPKSMVSTPQCPYLIFKYKSPSPGFTLEISPAKAKFPSENGHCRWFGKMFNMKSTH